jgi:hypothetical protein
MSSRLANLVVNWPVATSPHTVDDSVILVRDVGGTKIAHKVPGTRLNPTQVLIPEDYGATAGTGNNTVALQAWFADIIATGKPGFLPSNTYPCTSQMYWDMSGASTNGVKIFGCGIGNSIIDMTGVSSSPAFRIGGNTDLFYGVFKDFGISGNLAGSLLTFGHYTAPDVFVDPMNVFTLDLWVSNSSTSSSAVAVEFNYYLNSPYTNLVANTGGNGDPVVLRQCVFNNFHGSWSTGRAGVHYVDDGYNYGNVFHAVDFENIIGYPITCDSGNTSNQLFVGGTVVWHNGDANGGAFLMNEGNNNFRAIGTQFSRNDAGSIHPLVTGTKAAVVQIDTEIVGTFNFEAVNIAPRTSDGALVIVVPSGFTGSVTFQDENNNPTWQIASGDLYDDPINITRYDINGIAIDNPVSINSETGIVTMALGLAISSGSKLGTFGAVPILQPTNDGSSVQDNVGSTNAVFEDTGFTGGVGSRPYTMGQIVAALKNLGLIASS